MFTGFSSERCVVKRFEIRNTFNQAKKQSGYYGVKTARQSRTKISIGTNCLRAHVSARVVHISRKQ